MTSARTLISPIMLMASLALVTERVSPKKAEFAVFSNLAVSTGSSSIKDATYAVSTSS